MQRQSAAFPRDSAGAAAFEEILALVAGDRGARPFENSFEPWTGAPLVAWIVDSHAPGRASDRTPPPGSASFAIQPTSAAPASPKNRRACAPFLGLSLARCSASDPESPLLPLARRPPCGTTNPSTDRCAKSLTFN